MNKESRVEKIIPPLAGSLLILLMILIINRDYPYVGHDYRYFIPRLVDTDLHIRLNGWNIQWYTPSFGGGLPAFPNPQHMEYSIVQLLTVFWGPWVAVLLTTAIVSFIGYYFFFEFLHQRLGLHYTTSTLGAMFFIGNGFYIEHMISGHLGFQLFPLISVFLYILTDTEQNILFKSVVIALLLSILIHHAGFIISIIMALSLLMSFPIVYLYKPDCIHPKHIALIGSLALLLSLGITGSKLYAVSAFMQYFPRHISDVYNVSEAQALMGIVAQLFGMTFLTPIALLTGTNTDLLSGALSNITGAKYGIWELDIALSPVLLFFLLRGLAHSFSKIRANGIPKPDPGQFIAILFLITMTWMNLELTIARGPIYTLTKQLPILQSLHVNVRFTSVFILPLVIVGAILSEGLLKKARSLVSFSALAALTLLFFSSYLLLSQDLHSRRFDLSPLRSIREQIKMGNRFPIQKISDTQDLDAFLQSASSYWTYEVLFGYELEDFKPQTHSGDVFEEENGYYNMTNPTGFVFPQLNNTRLFERFKTSDRNRLMTFLQRRQPEWAIPVTQKILNWVSLVTLVTCLSILLLPSTITSRKK